MTPRNGKKKAGFRQSQGPDARSGHETPMFSFRNQPDLHANGPDSLGQDYDATDREVDIQAGESLRQLPVPDGLADRVTAASLTQLQQATRMRIGVSRSGVAFKRLAVAACLTIALIAAFWVTGPNVNRSLDGSGGVVAHQEGASSSTPMAGVVTNDFRYRPAIELLASLDANGLILGHDLTWADAHDELLSILEAQHSGDAWGYLELEMR
jgi:hypothetical protein